MARSGSAIEDAPSDYQYDMLLRSAKKRVDEKFRDECILILRSMGELGMRPGEVTHLSRSWFDFKKDEIVIPSYDPCSKGENGGPCTTCRDMAKQSADLDNDNYSSVEEALQYRWKPKNSASKRDLWFGWDEELVDFYEEFFANHERYPKSRASINRRIDRVAANTPNMNVEDIYPQSLRARAGKFYAGEGMRIFELRRLLGLEGIDTALDYFEATARDTRSELERIHR